MGSIPCTLIWNEDTPNSFFTLTLNAVLSWDILISLLLEPAKLLHPLLSPLHRCNEKIQATEENLHKPCNHLTTYIYAQIACHVSYQFSIQRLSSFVGFPIYAPILCFLPGLLYQQFVPPTAGSLLPMPQVKVCT